MLVHLCLSVLLTVTSLVVFISTVTYELINDDDDDDDIQVGLGCHSVATRQVTGRCRLMSTFIRKKQSIKILKVAALHVDYVVKTKFSYSSLSFYLALALTRFSHFSAHNLSKSRLQTRSSYFDKIELMEFELYR